MKQPFLTRQWVFVFVAGFLVTSLLTVAVFSARHRNQKSQKQVVALPEVLSHVQRLRVTNVSVRNQLTPDAVAVLEVLNTSDSPVMSIEISTINKAGDSGAIGDDGLTDPNNPMVVIPPFESRKFEMNFGEMVPDAPLVISAAEFGDGSAEGDSWSREAMRVSRAQHQKKLANRKGGDRP